MKKISSLISGIILFSLTMTILFSGCTSAGKVGREYDSHNSPVEYSDTKSEKHLKNLRQLTFEGTHAEAYFSPDGKKLIFQGRDAQNPCDQMYILDIETNAVNKISINGGRTTCGFFINNEKVLFSSTHQASNACPKERDRSKGYIWEIFKTYDVFSSDLKGKNLKALTRTKGYDAESTVCDDKIVFTSARSGESLQIYTMKTDGSQLKQLTSKIGYNGGPFFSPDCKKITYRAHFPAAEKIQEFKSAIHEGYIPHGDLEIHTMNSDGKNKMQLTKYNGSSFAPSFFPDSNRIIFSSNLGSSTQPRVFQLYAISGDKQNQPASSAEKITHIGSFNGFPMFSPDGKYIVFASNRSSSNPHELQIFLAEWIE